MRRQQLTEAQITVLLLNPPTDQRELIRHYTLSAADLGAIRAALMAPRYLEAARNGHRSRLATRPMPLARPPEFVVCPEPERPDNPPRFGSHQCAPGRPTTDEI